MRFGAIVHNHGGMPRRVGLTHVARGIEAAGFDSVWCSDHIVMPSEIRSRYPFSSDGIPHWSADTDWYEAVVTLAAMATATERIEIGSAVIVAAVREPLLLAKQLASIDAIAGGRTALGVGAGWMADEFAAFGVPFDERGERLDEMIPLFRDIWTGRPPARQGRFYSIPAGLNMFPTPARIPPVLIGGSGRAALRRAGTIADGWLALERAGEIDCAALAAQVATIREHAVAFGREPGGLRFVLSVGNSANAADAVAQVIPGLVKAGFTDLIADAFSAEDSDPVAYLGVLRAAVEA